MDSELLPDIDPDKIACQQILAEDQSVYSIQWVVIPTDAAAGLTAAAVLQLYLDYIERVTVRIIRVVTVDRAIEFRIAGTSLALLSFTAPQFEKSGEAEKCSLLISGGALVQPKECDRGQLDFLITPVANGCRVVLRLSDYCPLLLGSRRPARWRKWLYRCTQAYLHKVITVSFLKELHEKKSGQRSRKSVVRIVVRKGDNT
ncbi:MAG: hypothetical protein FIA91_09905 [Geobacter sp.]|nr:hypothetical protein [Geobacter sp.]